MGEDRDGRDAADGGRGRRGTGAWIGAAVAVAITAAVPWVWNAVDQSVPGAPLVTARILGPDVVVALVLGAVIWALGRFLLRRWRPGWPAAYAGALVAALVTFVLLPAGLSPLAWYAATLLLLLAATLIGRGIGALVVRAGTPGTTLPALVAAAALLAAAVWFAVPTGSPPTALPEEGEPTTTVEDLSAPGPEPVATLTYGSGTDRRARYGADVGVRTPTVDLSDVLTGWSDGAGGDRTTVYGFDATALPVNATVWYPEAEGPRPLVLVLHGNKGGSVDSELGFTYLAEALAGRGMVVALVDAGFLDTGIMDSSAVLGGLEETRALLLLEHLRAWEELAQEGPLAGRVDLERVALVGHSRGGEAAANAAALTRSGEVPEYPERDVDLEARVVSVVGIAPSGGLYGPGGEGAGLDGVDYLGIQGSHDLDVLTVAGAGDQLERTTRTDGSLAALVSIGGADHSQFNTQWGRRDFDYGLPKAAIAVGSLLEGADQRRFTTGYLAAFLGTTLLDQDHVALLWDHRAGADWLPSARVISTFASGSDTLVLSGREDADPATGTLEGSTVESADAELAEGPLPLRLGGSENSVLTLTPEGERPRITVDLGAELTLDPDGWVRVDAAASAGADAQQLVLTVTDADGATASVEASAPPPIDASGATKLPFLRPGAPSEPVLQTVSVPVSDLADGGVDPERVTAVEVSFPGAGVPVLLDDLALTTAP